MNKRKVITIVLGIIIILVTIIMPFHLKQVCYEYSMHQDWSLASWNAVQIISFFYSVGISLLALTIILINVFNKSK